MLFPVYLFGCSWGFSKRLLRHLHIRLTSEMRQVGHFQLWAHERMLDGYTVYPCKTNMEHQQKRVWDQVSLCIPIRTISFCCFSRGYSWVFATHHFWAIKHLADHGQTYSLWFMCYTLESWPLNFHSAVFFLLLAAQTRLWTQMFELNQLNQGYEGRCCWTAQPLGSSVWFCGCQISVHLKSLPKKQFSHVLTLQDVEVIFPESPNNFVDLIR